MIGLTTCPTCHSTHLAGAPCPHCPPSSVLVTPPPSAVGTGTDVGLAVARWLEPQQDPHLSGPSVSVTDWLIEDLLTPPREPRTDLIVEILRARRRQGIARYGAELRTWNGRDATADALQEAVDLLLYVAQRQIESGGPYSGRLTTVYSLVRWLAEELERADLERL